MKTTLLRRAGGWLLALLLLAAGTWHFVRPLPFIHIVPPGIRWPLAVVYLSGMAELVLGLGLLIPGRERTAALGAAAFFVAVFPANVYHWLADVPVEGRVLPGWYHLIRLPMQAVLVAWALWLARRPAPVPPGPHPAR